MTGHVAIYAWDRPHSADARAAMQTAHFAHIETIMDRIAIAGPIKDDAGNNIGSLFILKVASAGDADTILRSDPYFDAGVWERWEIHPFRAAAGEWIGGKIW